MGYQKGEGLGRNKQGITTAIEVKMREKKKGLGHGGVAEHKLIPDADIRAAEPQQQVRSLLPAPHSGPLRYTLVSTCRVRAFCCRDEVSLSYAPSNGACAVWPAALYLSCSRAGV